jgi:hypothetical protein
MSVTEKTQPMIKLIRCLYNSSSGMLRVSAKCREKYKETYLEDLKYDYRMNKKLHMVVAELGYNESCYNYEKSELVFAFIPEELVDYMIIQFENNSENIIIDYTRAYTELLDNIMENGLKPFYEEKYNRIKFIEKVYTKWWREDLDVNIMTEFIYIN